MSETPNPDFSLWLQRRIPFLERSATSPVYRAFKERRQRHRWLGINIPQWAVQRRYSPAGCAVLLALAMFALIPISLVSPFGSRRQIVVLGLLAVLALFVAIIWTRGKGGRTIPLRAAVAFNVDGMNADVALDLWMCGVTGRDIAEAIVLENLESVVLSSAFLQILASGIFLLVLLDGSAPPLSQVIYAIAIIGLGLASFWVILGSFPYGPQKNILTAVCSRWRRSDDLWTKVRRELPRQALKVALFFLTLVGLVMMIALGGSLVAFAIRILPSSIPFWVWPQSIGLLLAAAILLVMSVLVLSLRQREGRKLEAMLEQANLAFEIYIRGEILNDPDARRSVEEIMSTPAVDSTAPLTLQ